MIPVPLLLKVSTGNNLLKGKNSLNSLLSKLKVSWEAIYCKDFLCNVHSHFTTYFCADICEAYYFASKLHISMSTSSNYNTIPAWNRLVRIKKQESLYWHNLWRNN